ncbi:MAG: LCP family protein [Clostridium sp.]
MKKLSRILIATGAAAVSVLLACGVYKGYHSYQMKRQIEADIEAKRSTDTSEAAPAKGIIELDGKKYRRNTSIRATLCMGIDTSGNLESQRVSGAGGQSDGIFLVAQDMARDTVKIVMIPRDTMTEITLFDLEGNELGQDIQHLTLAFAYGDGREKSCKLMSEAVSNLFFGLRIDGYIAVNTSAIAILNDDIGGVPVTVEDVNGRKVKLLLKGKEAENFVRSRDVTVAQSALGRMKRQQQYIQSYIQTARAAAEEDDQLVSRMMNDIQDYMITNMSKDRYLKMGMSVLNSEQLVSDRDFITIPGQAVETQLFDEYHPDQEALKRITVELFCKEIDG